MSRISELWRERSQQAGRAADAEAKGFPGTAARAREAVARLERQIEAAQAEDATGTWSSQAHP